MNKITFTLYIVLIALIAIPQNSKAQTEYKLDSIQLFQFDDILESLQLKQRYHYLYDNGGLKSTEYIDSVKVSGIWSPYSKITRTFNGDNTVKTEIYQNWDDINMEWSNSFKIDYEYDAFENNTVQKYYSPDGLDWILNTVITQEFNENNQITTYLLEFSDPIYMISIKNRVTYTYENGNNTLIEVEDWTSTSGQWANNQKTVISYSGNLITQLDTFTWMGGPDWPLSPQSRETYDYLTNDEYSITYQSDSGSGLTNIFIYYYTYNGNKLLGYEIYEWDINTNGWKENSKANVSYDSNENFEEANLYDWDDINDDWAISNRYLYFWSEADPFVLATSSQKIMLAKIYPNPFQDELNISFKSALESESILQLFDLQGKEISKIELQQGTKSIKLNNPYLSKGVYFLHLNNTKTNQTFKIIKQ